jgi:hypothetical protein
MNWAIKGAIGLLIIIASTIGAAAAPRFDVAPGAQGLPPLVLKAQACPRGYDFDSYSGRCLGNAGQGSVRARPGYSYDGGGWGAGPQYRGTACPPGFDAYKGRCVANNNNHYGRGDRIPSRGRSCPRGYNYGGGGWCYQNR